MLGEVFIYKNLFASYLDFEIPVLDNFVQNIHDIGPWKRQGTLFGQQMNKGLRSHPRGFHIGSKIKKNLSTCLDSMKFFTHKQEMWSHPLQIKEYDKTWACRRDLIFFSIFYWPIISLWKVSQWMVSDVSESYFVNLMRKLSFRMIRCKRMNFIWK